ncbi:MAG: PPC domain-containing protein [Phycisphaeraceae bacterium]
MTQATLSRTVAPLARCLIVLAGFFGVISAHAGLPTLTDVLPVAGERGKTIRVTLVGERLHDATAVLFHTEGIAAEHVAFKPKEKGENRREDHATATFTIAPDAPVGEHQLRLVTATGVSEMLTFHVVDRPLMEEGEGTLDQPQPVDMGTTILGRTTSEDVDYFGVELNKGQRLSVQVDGMRLGRGFTDAYLAVLDDAGQTVVESDDTALLRQDPYLALTAPADGRYTILIRDSGYEGGERNHYMLHVGDFPRPAVTFPLGGRPGETVPLRFLGDLSGPFVQQVTLPNQPDSRFVVTPTRDGRRAPTGHALRVNPLDNVNETDSDVNGDMNKLKDAPASDVPVAFNGIIEKPGDMDYYKLRLKKGQAVTIHCYASSMGSPLDSVVNLFNAEDRKHIQGNDDQDGSDSVLTFTAPKDGAYFLRVRDHLNEGGPTFVYRLEVTVARPMLTTAISVYDRNRPQSRQAIVVPRGNRTAALVRVNRGDVGGDVTPLIDGLPAGLTYVGLGPAQRGDVMPVVFEAPADALLGAKLVDLGVQSGPRGDSAERVTGGFQQRTPLVIANPNRTEYYHSTIDRIPVAVGQAVPFRIDVEQPAAPLVHNGKLQLKVTLTREDGYDGLVRLYPLYLPNGMGATSRVDLNKDKTQAVFHFDANAGVATRAWPLVIYGFGNVKGGPVWVSSPLFEINVEPPFVTGSIEMATVTQGGSVDITVNLQHPREWEGEGELKLLGLPAACEVEPVTIKPGQDKATFRVKVSDKTPVGRHKSLVCDLKIQVHGQPVVHRFGGGGQLRVDRPKTQRNAQAKRGE